MSTAPKRLSKKEKLAAFNKYYRTISRIECETDQDIQDFKELMPHFKNYDIDKAEYKAIYDNIESDTSRAGEFLTLLQQVQQELEQDCAPVDDVNKMDDDDDIDPMDEIETKSDIAFVAGADEVEYESEAAKKKAERRLRKGANAEELYRQHQNQADAEEEKHLERVVVKPAAARVLPAASFGQTASKKTSLMDTKDIEVINDTDDEEMKDAGTESEDPGAEAEAEGEGEPEVKVNSKKRAKTSAVPKTEARIYQFGETFYYKGNEYKVTDGPRPGFEHPPLVYIEGKLQPDWDKIEYEHLTTAHGRNPNKKDVVDYHNFVQADGMLPVFVTGEKAKKIDNAYKQIPNQVHPYMADANKTNNLIHFKNGAIRTKMCMANYRQLSHSKAEKKSVTANRLGKVKVTPEDRAQASHCLTLMKTEFADSVSHFEKGFQPFAPGFETSEYLANLQGALELLATVKKTNNLFNDFSKYFEKNDPDFLKKFIIYSSIVFPAWRKTNESYLSNL